MRQHGMSRLTLPTHNPLAKGAAPALVTGGDPSVKCQAARPGRQRHRSGPFIPRFAGQNELYLKIGLQAFRAGIRRNLDPNTVQAFKNFTDQKMDVPVK